MELSEIDKAGLTFGLIACIVIVIAWILEEVT